MKSLSNLGLCECFIYITFELKSSGVQNTIRARMRDGVGLLSLACMKFLRLAGDREPCRKALLPFGLRPVEGILASSGIGIYGCKTGLLPKIANEA